MSNMLEQVIIDAEDLKNAAQKSAQEKIIEHFSEDIKKAMDMILEQEDPFATMAPTEDFLAEPTEASFSADPSLVDIPAEASEGAEFVAEQVPFSATTRLEDVVSIDLNRLEESLNIEEEKELIQGEEEKPLEEDDYVDLEEMVAEILAEEYEETLEEDKAGHAYSGGGYLPYGEEHPALEEDANTAIEDDEFEVDAPAFLEEEELEEVAPMPSPRVASEDHLEESKKLKKTNQTLLKENKQNTKMLTKLNEQNEKYQTLVAHLKEEVQRVNLSNAKLLYQNRVLNSTSLNERQKDRIVETIANAKSVEEAKIIYETLQSAVGANSFKSKPKSLNEVVTKRSSAFMPRKEEKKVNAFSDRMKILAGLK